MKISEIIKFGILENDDIVLRKRATKTNAYTLTFILSLLVVFFINIARSNYLVSIIIFAHALLVAANYLYFLRKRNIESYPDIFSGIFLYILLMANFFGGIRGLGPYMVEVFILISFSIMRKKWASILIIILLTGNLSAYFLGDKIDIIYNYREVIPVNVFINFFTVHLVIGLIALINSKNQENGFKELDFEKNKNKQLFLNLVHDLKTPLTILENSIDQTACNYPDIDELDRLKNTVNDMSKNIVSIIDLEKENNEELSSNLQSINISDLTDKIVSSYNSISKYNNVYINFKIEKGIYIKSTELDYRKILTNLIDNAIKYNRKNGSVFISLYKTNDSAYLRVRDQGTGIKEADKERIFEPYTQLERGIQSKYGLGLGLSIVKRICNYIDADISIESLNNDGTAFTIQFHTEESTHELDEYVGDIKPQSGVLNHVNQKNKKTILVVDDHNEIRDLIYQALYKEYNILLASDGLEALSMVTNNIDIIITDIMMPEMDGLNFVSKIKNKNVPILIISAKSITEDRIKGLSYGAIDFIAKPFSISELKLKIDSILSVIENERKYVLNRVTDNINNFADKIDKFNGLDNLTKKENEIVEYLLNGTSQKQIAVEMELSINTVKSHLQRIYKKYDVNSVTALLSKIN